MRKVKVIAFDLDGTLCQHKSPLPPENIETLNRLGKHYKLLMAGAGQCGRIFRQMAGYPIDVIGNYGGTEFQQLCLAFNSGDGGRASCLNTVDAVSSLLF